MALRDWNHDGKKNFIDDLIEYDIIFDDDDEDEDDFDDDLDDDDDDDF
jgi:hypothetical protein